MQGLTRLLSATSRWALVPVAAIAAMAWSLAVPQRAGLIAAFVAVAPVLVGGIVFLLVPLAALRRDGVLAVSAAATGVLASLLWAPSAPPAVTLTNAPLTLMTWNLHAEPIAGVGLRDAIARWDPDILVLQEADLARRSDADVVPSDMTLERYPEAATPPGMAIATRLPVLATGTVDQPEDAWDRPRAFWLTLDTDGLDAASRPLTVVGVHLAVPFPISSLPCPYCPSQRDAQVRALAEFAQQRVAAGESVVIAGDFNLTEREVAYRDLAGLTDAARGLTWRPLANRWLPPLLRLDYVLVGEGIGVASSEVDCSISHSDHCPVVVWMALP